MFKIKKFFRGLTLNSEFEKAVVKLKESKKSSVLKEKDIFGNIQIVFSAIQEAISGRDPLVDQTKAYQFLFAQMSQCLNPVGCLKFIYLIHKLMFRMETPFITQVVENRLNNFSNLLKFTDHKDVVSEFQGILVCYYYRFLYTICVNYELLRYSLNYLDTGRVDEFMSKELSYQLKGLIKLLKTLIFIARIEKIIEYALVKISSPLLKQMAAFILNDFHLIYDFIQACVTKMKERIFDYDPESACLVYKLYQDTIRVTRQMSKFYELRHLISDIDVKQPKLFHVDAEENRKIELYMNQLLKQNIDQKLEQNISGCGMIENNNFVIARTHHMDESTFVTSNTMIQILFDNDQEHYQLIGHDDI